MAEEEDEARSRRTRWLVAGGALSLILPLLGVLYLRITEGRGHARQTGVAVFERREGSEQRLLLPSAPAPPAAVVQAVVAGGTAGAGSSLDFVKGAGGEFVSDKPQAAAPPPAPAPEPPPSYEPPPQPEPAPSRAASAAAGKKPFNMPRLNPGKGFTAGTWGSRMGNPGRGAPAGAPAGMPGSPQSMQDMLKNLPQGSGDTPDLQKYLKSR